MRWQPISTAPREHKAPAIGLAAFDPRTGEQVTPPVYCWWDGVIDDTYRGWSGWPLTYPNPTHWHPQPAEREGA